MKSIIPIFLVVLLFSCIQKREGDAQENSERVTISVVNYPLYYFAKSIVGELATIYLPANGGDPSYWKPSAKQVSNYQISDLILANGAGYAKWMEKVSLPSSKIVYTASGFKDKWIETEEIIIHSHGPEGEHSHKGTANTTWLNFEFARAQAKSCYAEILKLLPNDRDEIERRYQTLDKDLAQLDAEMKSIAAMLGDMTIAASHPLYQYLEAAYGLDCINMHWEPDEMPEDEAWDDFSSMVKNHGISIMLWEGDPMDEINKRLEELNVKIVVFKLCGNKPQQGDFLDVMNQNLQQFSSAIKATADRL